MIEMLQELRQSDRRHLHQGTHEAPSRVEEARETKRRKLTPMQRLRQLEPSWFRSGQTTSLLASVIEKEEVKADRGGILSTTPPCAGGDGSGEWWD